ncbi:MAG: HD domain-containing protein [Myxococcota bacterium]
MVDTPSSTLAAGRQALEVALRRGRGGAEMALVFADVIDAMVHDIASAAFAQADLDTAGMCLAAVGGLGRRELAPHSDLDLVLLAPGVAAEDPALEALVRAIVHPLWDAGLRANVRSDEPGAWLDDAASDITSCTGLLDLRPITGDGGVVDTLRARAFDEFLGPRRDEFLDRLEDEAQERHAKYGGTVYLVEPDLKHGPGGLRDLAAMEWGLRAAYRTADLGQLALDEHVPPNMAALLQEARDTILKLRIGLHLVAKRAQERLVFQYQELLPPLMGRVEPGCDDATLVQAVEETMQEYYRSARVLLRYGQRMRERCRTRRNVVSMVRRLDDRFSVRKGRLEYRGAQPIAARPALAIESLARARDRHVPLAGQTFDAIAEALAVPSMSGMADDAAAHAAFFELLTNPQDVAHPSALEEANELGVLEAIVPEFGDVRGRMQHDTYHVYTVDQHTLAALAMLKRIARGDHNKDYPLATSLHLEIEDDRVLYLAALVHDTGKASGRDQCESGAEVAWETARRLGLGDAAVARCSMLVAEHLTMPLLSQKRDLSDAQLIGDFARRVGSPQALRELYLLSLVDTASVRPGNLTGWKLALLDELYLLARAHMRRGTVVPPHQEPAEDEPLGMPERYRSLFDADIRNQHGALVQRMLAEGARPELELDAAVGGLRFTLAAMDRPGLLAQTMSVFRAFGIEVMAADIFSTTDDPPVAVDVFRVQARDGEERGIEPEVVAQMAHQLAQPWGPEDLQRPPQAKAARLWSPRARTPTTVTFEDDPSRTRTIIEVETEREVDTLERITLALAAEGIDILLARINVEAERAVDIFYVESLTEAQQNSLADRLEAYLDPGA